MRALAIVADAGFGKTELLKYYEWRFATRYQNAAANSRATMLPPIALRIPLREAHELTLESISELLTSGANDCKPLPAIRGPQALQMLLNYRRVILLLDGLDELKLPPDRFGDRLQRLRQKAARGGFIVLATRQGHLQSALSVSAKFNPSEIATIKALPRTWLSSCWRYTTTRSRLPNRSTTPCLRPLTGCPCSSCWPRTPS